VDRICNKNVYLIIENELKIHVVLKSMSQQIQIPKIDYLWLIHFIPYRMTSIYTSTSLHLWTINIYLHNIIFLQNHKKYFLFCYQPGRSFKLRLKSDRGRYALPAHSYPLNDATTMALLHYVQIELCVRFKDTVTYLIGHRSSHFSKGYWSIGDVYIYKLWKHHR